MAPIVNLGRMAHDSSLTRLVSSASDLGERVAISGEGAGMGNLAQMDELIGRIERAAAAIAGERDRVEAGEPWPLAERFDHAPEASWGPRETLAHITEMLPFWLGEIERILAGPGEPAPFGRVASNELRIGVIERDRSLPLRELFGRLEAGAGRVTRRLGELTPAETERTGVHPTLGVLTVRQAAERFVAGHLEEHVGQIAAILDARGG
jgi:DinB family protein